MEITRDQAAAWRENTADSPFNRWLNPQVQGRGGGLDLDRLHEVARRYGIDKQGQYAHLNPGQQRMAIGNMLRKRVDPAEYGGASTGPSVLNARSVRAPRGAVPAVPARDRPDAIRQASVRDLLRMHGDVLDELHEREVIRTLNAPTGDYAELLFATAFGWALEGNSSAGHDATDAQGVRYQIKCRRLTPRNGSRQLSAIRRIEANTFDYVAAVLFDQSFGVFRAAIIPHAIVAAGARFRPHTNAWLFQLRDEVWNLEGVRDVTREVAKAAEQI